MTTEERYNGWTNRETWAVALHINNDQGWQESVREALRSLLTPDPEARTAEDDDEDPTGEWHALAMRGRAGDVVRFEVEDVLDVNPYIPEDCQNYVKRVLPIRNDIGSLWRVDWTELGATFLADLQEMGDE